MLVTAASLTRSSAPWFMNHRWETVIADEGQEFLQGNHTKKTLTNTLQNWYQLQHRSRSIFILSGTPFVTNIPFDAERMIIALGTEG